MSITIDGINGEKMARAILKDVFKVENIFQLDWIVYKNGIYYAVEVKHKELFMPPPFIGQGLDIRQVKARTQLYKDKDIRCLFLVISKQEEKVYWQWLDILEQTKYFDTKNKIRVYDIKEFHCVGKVEKLIPV